MEYTVGSFSKLLGISAETLRHYERLGLIKPDRDINNQYRRYTLSHIFPVLCVRQKQSLGMSLSDIADIMNGMPVEQQLAWIMEKENEIDQEIQRLEQMKSCFDRFYHRLERSEGAPVNSNEVTIEMLPDTYRLFIESIGVDTPAYPDDVIRKWVQEIFFTHISLHISDPFALEDRFTNMSIGLGLLGHVQQAAQLPLPEGIVKAPKGRGIAMAIKTANPLLLKPSDLRPLRDAARRYDVLHVKAVDASVDSLISRNHITEYSLTFRTLIEPEQA